MTRFKTSLAALCVLGLTVLAVGQARAEDWIRADSDHFQIYSSAPEKKTRAYIQKLEAFRTLTNMLLGSSDGGPQTRFKIYLLNNEDQMVTVRPSFSRYVAGVYFNSAEGTSAYSAIQSAGDLLEDQDQSLSVLFHEYSHYVMFQHARRYYPAWYVEGFAEYLSTADPDKGTITIGEPSKSRGYTLAADRWIDFKKVLNPDFGFTGDKSNNAWEIESFYAQSWLLTHYMLSDNDRAKALNTYFARVAAGEDPVTTFEAATGIKVEQLQTILSRYQQKMFYLKVPVADYADSAITVSKLPANASQFMLSGALLETGVDDAQGKALLASLTVQKAAAAGDLTFRLALARAQILCGAPADALPDLTAILAGDPANFEANYLTGRAYMKQADAKSGENASDLIDQARSSFLAAYRLNKLNAPNLYYLARSFSNKPGFPDKNVLNAANGAHVLAPGVIDYAAFAAFADLANDQREAAVATLMPFVSDPHNRAQAERIQKTVDAIKAGKPTHEIMSLLGGS